jgi:hypothetical protein
MKISKFNLCLSVMKLQTLVVALVTLSMLQVNLPALALSLTDDHNLSVKQYNGSIYLVLGHHHHVHHHEHASRHSAGKPNHHSHQDHLIKLPDIEGINISTSSYQDIDSDYQITFDSDIKPKQFLSLLEKHSKLLHERYRRCSYHQELKNIIQFLV